MKKKPFEVGDLVTSSWHPDDSHVVRKIVSIVKGNFGSGWECTADAGGSCPTCKRPHSSPVVGMKCQEIDSDYFKPFKNESKGHTIQNGMILSTIAQFKKV